MLKIKNITMRNFMSVGNVTQAVTLDRSSLTLVLGNNVDMGAETGNRNGTGKTTMINALSYALYGNALTKIKQDNLINKTNGKQMLVTVDFEFNGEDYRIERGRRPAIFRFGKNGVDLNGNAGQDEAQGENRHTQVEVENIIGISHNMFKHIVALNTYTEPFLSMRAADQREIIEELLGVTELSRKAESLREQIKNTKDLIKEEEYAIGAKEEANRRILDSIAAIQRRQKIWARERDSSLTQLRTQLDTVSHIDISVELQTHIALQQYFERKSARDQATKWVGTLTKNIAASERTIDKLTREIEAIKSHTCYACGNELHDDKQAEILVGKNQQLADEQARVVADKKSLDEYATVVSEIGELGEQPVTYYNTQQDAYDHQTLVNGLTDQIRVLSESSDPYADQISEMQANSLETIDYENMNALILYKDHQEFLLKLLTNKDSFIRKKIIDQNLSYLNSRLGYFLEKLGLPHEVKFVSDLTVEITELSRDLDFDNLSRGERNRLILGLSWAFRDIFESLYNGINVLFVDELIDSGMDGSGVEASLSILKKMSRENGRSVFLVSHREELMGRVSNVLNVVKENGFTTFIQEDETISTDLI